MAYDSASYDYTPPLGAMRVHHKATGTIVMLYEAPGPQFGAHVFMPGADRGGWPSAYVSEPSPAARERQVRAWLAAAEADASPFAEPVATPPPAPKARKVKVKPPVDPRTAKAVGQALADLVALVEKRNTIPVLSGVLVEADAGELRLTATDMDMQATRTVHGFETREPFAVVLRAADFAAILRKAPANAEFSLRHEPAPAEVAHRDHGRVILRYGRNEMSLPIIAPARDFPVMAETDGATATVEGLALGEGLAKLLPCVSREATRYYLNGVHFRPVEGETVMEATDGHRAARARLAGVEGLPGVILPHKAASWLAKRAKGVETVELTVTAAKFRADLGGGFVFTSKVIDGTFPDLDRIMGTGEEPVVVVSRDDLRDALNLVMAVTERPGQGPVRLQRVGDELRLSCRCPSSDAVGETFIPARGDSEAVADVDGATILRALGVFLDDEPIAIARLDALCTIRAVACPEREAAVSCLSNPQPDADHVLDRVYLPAPVVTISAPREDKVYDSESAEWDVVGYRVGVTVQRTVRERENEHSAITYPTEAAAWQATRDLAENYRDAGCEVEAPEPPESPAYTPLSEEYLAEMKRRGERLGDAVAVFGDDAFMEGEPTWERSRKPWIAVPETWATTPLRTLECGPNRKVLDKKPGARAAVEALERHARARRIAHREAAGDAWCGETGRWLPSHLVTAEAA